jgi:Putative Flp pilus-assembly TadE/G-like
LCHKRANIVPQKCMQKSFMVMGRRGERGQTIILVAISLISLLAMAALAIDVVTLYVARTEIQRAADAAALAGAKAMADSGITTLPTSDPQFSSGAVQLLAQSMATSAIAAVLATPNNQVSGFTVAPGSPTFNFSTSPGAAPINNPHVTVTLQQTGLPTFFAHIWGTRTATASATATAEAYNPANTGAGNAFAPIAPRSVKPWLVANLDPVQAPNTFVNAATGAVESGVVGENFDLDADCSPGHAHHCHPTDSPPKAYPKPPAAYPYVGYVPAPPSTNPANVCPACAGGSDYEQTIECADANPYPYYQCGTSNNGTTISWWDGVNPGTSGTHDSANGAQCLIHATAAGAGQGQDTLSNPNTWASGPFQITGQSGNPVTTSSSIVTIPLIDTTAPFPPFPGGPVTVVGYLQAFINGVEPGFLPGAAADDINITVLNVVGCNPNANGTPVVGGSGASAIPVRLITPP